MVAIAISAKRARMVQHVWIAALCAFIWVNTMLTGCFRRIGPCAWERHGVGAFCHGFTSLRRQKLTNGQNTGFGAGITMPNRPNIRNVSFT